MKLEPRSPDAIRIYMLLGGATAGFLLAFFLVVPILKSTCTWFTARCTSVTVQTGPNNSLLVSSPPYVYYYDGVRYIYAYGNNLAGTCPSLVVTGFSPTPAVSPPINNFCFRYTSVGEGEEEEETQVCADPLPVASCARVAAVVPGKPGKYTCDGTTELDSQDCCATIAPCADPKQTCVTGVPAVKQSDGSYKCERGRLDGAWCELMPQYVGGQYTCDGNRFTSTPECCNCTTSFTAVTYGGTTDAKNIYQPVFTVDATTMTLVPTNNGVLCGLKPPLVLEQFKDALKQPVKMTLDPKTARANVYAVFDVLRKNGIFIPGK